MTSIRLLARLTALGAVAVVLCLAPAVSAQGFKWWQADDVIKELVLTSEQTRQLEEIFQKALPTLKAQSTLLSQAEAEFERLIEKGDQKAMEQINVVETARAALNTSRAHMLWNMRKVLTQKQYTKFKAIQQQAKERQLAGAAADKRR